jgi:hypothetical protein
MYILVSKDNAAEYSKEIETLNQLYKLETGMTISDDADMYVIYKHPDHGIVGGAKITPIEQAKELDHYFLVNQYQVEDCWVLEKVFFHLDDDSPLQENPEQFEHLCRKFYQGLYQALLLIGHEYNKKVLLTLNPLEEHEDIKHFGGWPFAAQHMIESSLQAHDKVLGVLKINNI